jgi:radical SAM protein with 4Fe4S-binding SPASM domain
MTDKVIFDAQFSSAGIQIIPKQSENIYVVIAKPTRVCNADCSYCSSPPLEEMGDDWEPEWNIEKFKKYFDKVYPYMAHGAIWIWHGGEPMLMGYKFYEEAHAYATEQMDIHGRKIYFSMQSNLLGYNEKWFPVFSKIFGGSLSTSFDPDETQRSIKGNTETYSRVFKRVLNKVIEDGFRPMVIGVYTEETAHMMHKMYDWSLSCGEKSFPLRFNYCHPTGRLETHGEAIKPKTYGNVLIEVYNRWIKDVPNFTITPLDQMFKKVIGIDGEGHCPWTRRCGGRFIEIEPNGEIYNCADFADLGKKYCFGNLNDEITLLDMLNTKPALQIRRRVTLVPDSCKNCEHFEDCEGGCMRDATLYEHGLYGKFHYCESWKMVFARIKESILSGEADAIIIKYGCSVEQVKMRVKMGIQNHFDYSDKKMTELMETGLPSIYGYGGVYNLTYDAIEKYDPEYIDKSIKSANSLLKNISVKIISSKE